MKRYKKISLLSICVVLILFFAYKFFYIEQTAMSLKAKNQIAQEAVAQVMFAQWLKPDGSWANDMLRVNSTIVAKNDATIAVDFYLTLLLYGKEMQGGTLYEYMLMTKKVTIFSYWN